MNTFDSVPCNNVKGRVFFFFYCFLFNILISAMLREQLGKVELHGPHFTVSGETLNLCRVGIAV